MILLVLIVAACLAHLLDFASFATAMSTVEIEGERNPLVRVIYRTAGLPGLVLFKVAGLACLLCATAVVYLCLGALAASLGVVFLLLVGLVGTICNVDAIMYEKRGRNQTVGSATRR